MSLVVHALYFISITNPSKQVTDYIANIRLTGVKLCIEFCCNAVLPAHGIP
ncbi:MAG: hypothetical protein ACJAZ1_001649 [Yoonia sp.]